MADRALAQPYELKRLLALPYFALYLVHDMERLSTVDTVVENHPELNGRQRSMSRNVSKDSCPHVQALGVMPER